MLKFLIRFTSKEELHELIEIRWIEEQLWAHLKVETSAHHADLIEERLLLLSVERAQFEAVVYSRAMKRALTLSAPNDAARERFLTARDGM